MASWDQHLPPHVSNYNNVPHELQPAICDLMSPQEHSFLSNHQVITGPQLHSLAAQIVTMRCIRRSLKVAQVLEAKPEWKAACGRVLPSLGPLALLHEPLHKPPPTVLKRRKIKRRSCSGTPGTPKKLRKREPRPSSANPAARRGRPRKCATPVHKPTAKPRRAKTKNAKGACQAAANQEDADSDASCGVPFSVAVGAWLEGPTAGHLGGLFGEVTTPGTIDVGAKSAQGRAQEQKLAAEKLSTAAERPGGTVRQAAGASGNAANSGRGAEKIRSAVEEPANHTEGSTETAEECAEGQEWEANEPMNDLDESGSQQGESSGRMVGFSEEEEEEEQLLPLLPALKAIRMPAVAEEDNYCSVCGDEDEDDPENMVLMCEGPGCQVVVHQQCYSITKVPEGAWTCDGCAAGIPPSASVCLLCPCSGGALRRVTRCCRIRLPSSPRAVSAADALRTLAEHAEAGKADPLESLQSHGRSDHSSASTATAERVLGAPQNPGSQVGRHTPAEKQSTHVVRHTPPAAEKPEKSSSKVVKHAPAQDSSGKVSSSTSAPLLAREGQNQAPIQAPPSPQPAKNTLTGLADVANLAQPQPTKAASKKHALPPAGVHRPAKRRKSSRQGPWVHSACALWTPSVSFLDAEALEGVNLEGLTQKQIDVTCTFCKQGGSAVRCSFSKCSSTFHVLCARQAGCLLPISDLGDVLAFCGQHSHDSYAAQREAMICNEPPAAGDV